MNKSIIIIAVVAISLVLNMLAFAEKTLSGYENLGWNDGFSRVYNKYPGGQMMKFGGEAVYKQQKPTKSIARRSFGFKDGKLHAVSVTYEKSYVKRIGIERLLSELKRKLGEGTMDRSLAPHMIRYIWDGIDTKITFAYAPKRPDMTVIMYEAKNRILPAHPS